MVAATRGERQALLTAAAVRCAASHLRRRGRREERGTQKSHGKNEWRVEEHKEGQSQQGGRECVTAWWVKMEGKRMSGRGRERGRQDKEERNRR